MLLPAQNLTPFGKSTKAFNPVLPITRNKLCSALLPCIWRCLKPAYNHYISRQPNIKSLLKIRQDDDFFISHLWGNSLSNLLRKTVKTVFIQVVVIGITSSLTLETISSSNFCALPPFHTASTARFSFVVLLRDRLLIFSFRFQWTVISVAASSIRRCFLNLEFRLIAILATRSALLKSGFSRFSASSRIFSYLEVGNKSRHSQITFSWCSLNSRTIVSSSGSTLTKKHLWEQAHSILQSLDYLPITSQTNCILQLFQLGSVHFCLKIFALFEVGWSWSQDSKDTCTASSSSLLAVSWSPVPFTKSKASCVLERIL